MLNNFMFICKVTLPKKGFCPKNKKDNLFVIVFFPLIVFLYQSNYRKSFVLFFSVIVIITEVNPILNLILRFYSRVYRLLDLPHFPHVSTFFRILYLLITFSATNFTSPDYKCTSLIKLPRSVLDLNFELLLCRMNFLIYVGIFIFFLDE